MDWCAVSNMKLSKKPPSRIVRISTEPTTNDDLVKDLDRIIHKRKQQNSKENT